MDGPKGFKITRRSLDALRLSDRSERGEWRADRDLPGFYAVAYSTGRVSFFARYRVNGQRRAVKLGDYPAVMPENARKAALAVLGGAAKGEDESAKRKAAREAALGRAQRISFETWRKEDAKDAARRLRAPSEPARYLELAGAEWDRKALADLTTRDVETLRNRLAERGSTTANRWLTTLRASFQRAVRLGHVVANPAANVQPLRENPPRTRTLSPDEEKRLRKAIMVLVNPWEKAAYTLLLDTGARLSEVLKAKHEDFTLDAKGAGTWRIPSPKAGHPQAIPVLGHVGAVVAKTPRLTDCAFIVPSRNGLVRRHDLRKSWDRLRAAAKIPADLHVHDLRRSFGLRATLSVGIFGASKLLRHANTGVTERVYAPIAPQQMTTYAENVEAARVLAFRARKSA